MIERMLVVSVAGIDEPWLTGSAAQLARETGAAVTVLGVDDVESQRFEALPRAELVELARAAAERTANRLAEVGVAAQVAVRSGPAADAVIHFAEELGADLIVVGASPRAPLLERLLGSLALDLVQRSGRQVLVVAEPGA
ncbi:MAG TPA: universal stress protein [Thermoleophilaceae bacterium]|nr:universal stress protein [Thermoleophilaceae bacterium]